MPLANVGEIVLYYLEGDVSSAPTPAMIETISDDGVADLLLLHSRQPCRYRPAARHVSDQSNLNRPAVRKEYGTWDLTELGKLIRQLQLKAK